MGHLGNVEMQIPGEEAALPNFLIIGAMRSGTTWLARTLAEHPSVFMAPGKELHYFDAIPDKGLDWYRDRFAGADGETAVGEATPVYMYDRSAVDRIAAAVPTARLIAILRDPVDRAYSHYRWSQGRENETLSFSEALDAEPERLKDRRSRYRHSYVDRGRYATQIRHVLQLFPRTSLHILLFEEFRSAPEREFDALCRFLEVAEGVRPSALHTKMNAHYEFRSSGMRRMTKALPQKGPARVLRYVMWRANHRPVSNPPMPADVRKRLRDTFQGEIEDLAKILGRDLSCWTD